MPVVRWTVQKVADGWKGTVEVPDRHIAVSAKGNNKRTAVIRATKLAEGALESPIVRELLPPGAETAIKALGAIAKSKYTGEGVKAVGKGLKKFASFLGL
jgi:hypothetical protein